MTASRLTSSQLTDALTMAWSELGPPAVAVELLHRTGDWLTTLDAAGYLDLDTHPGGTPRATLHWAQTIAALPLELFAVRDTQPMVDSEQASFVDQLQEGIDAVLVSRGFAAGQSGAGDETRQIIWCAAADDFAARFPELPASQEPTDGWGSRCTDVVVDLTSVDGQWRVSEVSVEGEHLDRLLADLDRFAPAGRAAALIGTTAADSLALLPPLLTEMLDGADPRR